MRPAHPWYWAEKNAWYVEIAGERTCLGKHPEGVPKPEKRMKGKSPPQPPPEIKIQFHLVMAQKTGKVPKEAYRAVVICKLFIDWSEKHHEPKTTEWYRSYLLGTPKKKKKLADKRKKPDRVKPFCKLFGHIEVD